MSGLEKVYVQVTGVACLLTHSRSSSRLNGCLDFQFPSPITQNMWVPWLNGLFGDVFSFCFYHSILWFLSDKLWKLKTHFKCFQVMKQSYDDIFVNTHTLRDPWSDLLLSPIQLSFLFFFIFFVFHVGSHLSLFSSSSSSSSSSFSSFLSIFTLVSGFGCIFFFPFLFTGFLGLGSFFFLLLLLLLLFPFHIGFLGLVAYPKSKPTPPSWTTTKPHILPNPHQNPPTTVGFVEDYDCKKKKLHPLQTKI